MLAEWLEFRLDDARARSSSTCSRTTTSTATARCAPRAATSSRADRRARALRQRQGRRALRRRASALLGEHDIALRLDALHHLGDVLQLARARSRRRSSDFHEMLALAYRLDLKAKGGAAHNRIGRLYRDTGHARRGDAPPRHGASRCSRRAGTSAASRASSTTSARSTGCAATTTRRCATSRTRLDAPRGHRRQALDRAVAQQHRPRLPGQRASTSPRSTRSTRALELRREVERPAGRDRDAQQPRHHPPGQGRGRRGHPPVARGARGRARDRRQEAPGASCCSTSARGSTACETPTRRRGCCIEVEQTVRRARRPDPARRGAGGGSARRAAARRRRPRAALPRARGRALRADALARARGHRASARSASASRAWGYESEHGRRAEQLFRDSLEIFEEPGAELELARTARALRGVPAHRPRGRGRGADGRGRAAEAPLGRDLREAPRERDGRSSRGRCSARGPSARATRTRRPTRA